jgi:hypothetical protein
MKITTKELNELLQKEYERGRQSAINDLKQGEPIKPIESPPISIQAKDYIPEACRLCPSYPSNGGSGICHCILGLQPISYSTTTTFKL